MEIILGIATLLGGVTAIWYVVEQLIKWRNKNDRKQLDLSTLDSTCFRYAKPNDIDKIVKLDKTVFSESEIINKDILFEWHKKNSKIFTCLLQGSEVVGYFSILPLKSETLNRFVTGEIREEDFTSSDILRPKDAVEGCRDLYFFSIAITREYRRLFLRSFLDEIARELHRSQCGNGLKKIYVTAATQEGKSLIRRFKFKLIQKSEFRVDKHDLYMKEVSRIKDHRDYMKSQLDL